VDAKNYLSLDRVLSRLGLASRGAARQMIRAGRIRVNGSVCRDPDRWVRFDRDRLHLDGRRLQPARRVYVLLYKPKGIITSHGDPGGRKTVYAYLDQKLGWLAPVGRLDKDTSGLLLCTNDNDFGNYIQNPDSGVRKTYLVKLDRIIGEEDLARLAAGIRMKRGDYAKPVSLRRVEDRGKYSRLEVTLTEGKNREVRRMMEAAGFSVLKLVRTKIGHLTLTGLQVGGYRILTASEVRRFGFHRR